MELIKSLLFSLLTNSCVTYTIVELSSKEDSLLAQCS